MMKRKVFSPIASTPRYVCCDGWFSCCAADIIAYLFVLIAFQWIYGANPGSPEPAPVGPGQESVAASVHGGASVRGRSLVQGDASVLGVGPAAVALVQNVSLDQVIHPPEEIDVVVAGDEDEDFAEWMDFQTWREEKVKVGHHGTEETDLVEWKLYKVRNKNNKDGDYAEWTEFQAWHKKMLKAGKLGTEDDGFAQWKAYKTFQETKRKAGRKRRLESIQEGANEDKDETKNDAEERHGNNGGATDTAETKDDEHDETAAPPSAKKQRSD